MMNSVDLCIIICAILFSGVAMFVPNIYQQGSVSCVENGKEACYDESTISHMGNVEVGKNTLKCMEPVPMTEEYNNWLKQFVIDFKRD